MIKLFTSCASGPKSAGPVATGREPFAIAINPDGKAAYVANFEDQTISQYDIGPGGALTPTIPATAAVAGNPLALAVTPNGKDVYVTTNGGPLLQYSVGTDETLTAKNHPRSRPETAPPRSR